mgnify:CR=1 FL=1
MKKIVFLSLFALCLPWTLVAQSIDDDLYYTPSKNKEEKKEEVKQEKKVAAPVEEIVVKSNVPTTVYSSPGSTTVVVKDRKGNTRDVDEYNRRYDSRDNDFVMENDTLYINEKEDDGLDGEWVNGEFEGSQDDYEYATRIIRFRNPRYAISISSPLYWDVVYGLNSWDWNVYTDGLYAYAFPTFTNACGGIGAITLMVGAVILTMAGDGTAGTVRAGALAWGGWYGGAGGDIIITITIIPDIIPVAVVIGEAAIGEMHIPIDVLMVRAVLLMPETEYRPLLPAVLLL